MSRIPLFTFIPGYNPEIRQDSEQEYSAARTHKERPVKERPYETPHMEAVARYLAVRTKNIGRQIGVSEQSVRRRLLSQSPFQILLKAGFKVKPFGYNYDIEIDRLPVASRGTSIPETVIATAFTSSCIGVAIGGEKIVGGEYVPGAKTRVFHIFNCNNQPVEEVYNCIVAMQDKGLTVKAAMTGGMHTETAYAHADELREMFAARNVEQVFDRTGSSEYAQTLRESGWSKEEIEKELMTPLVSVIHKDHRVQHGYEVAQLIETSEDVNTQ